MAESERPDPSSEAFDFKRAETEQKSEINIYHGQVLPENRNLAEKLREAAADLPDKLKYEFSRLSEYIRDEVIGYSSGGYGQEQASPKDYKPGFADFFKASARGVLLHDFRSLVRLITGR